MQSDKSMVQITRRTALKSELARKGPVDRRKRNIDKYATKEAAKFTLLL
jgi:hypothetical protein